MAQRFDNVHGAEGSNRILQAMSSTPITNARTIPRRHSHRAGLRTVALVEALKGVLALLGAYVFIRMIRHDVNFGEAAGHILFFFHISLKHHLSRQFLDAAGQLSGTSLGTIFGIAIVYATLRFLEGYGLWRQRAWAEWLAIVSGCIYLPFELYKLVRRPNQLHGVILGINILVVLYIGWVRWDEIKAEREQQFLLPGQGD
jgi:uncharacterized membrane protein (DUF2068 family)